MKLKILELFAGTRSIGKAFERKQHDVFSVDWGKEFEDINWCDDVLNLTPEFILDNFGKPDVIWASPDCTTYSIAAISHHRFRDEFGILQPKSDYAKKCDLVNKHVRHLIEVLKPSVFFIENPRGGMRKTKLWEGFNQHTITYCQYGDFRMKPTDIWTNLVNPEFKAMCKNGDSCHEAAPRGSKTGTQSLSKKDRSKIPDLLCDHIVNISERVCSV